jgi:hypothetical protein
MSWCLEDLFMFPGEEIFLKHFLSSSSFIKSEGHPLLRLLPGNSSRPYKKRHSLLLSMVKAVLLQRFRFEATWFRVGKCRT